MDTNVRALDQAHGDGWSAYQGDNCELIRALPDRSVGYNVFSIPFSSLYTYSPSERDMGNVRSDEEFFAHFDFLVPELLRVTKRGRLCSIHVMQLPTSKERDGYIGLRDFRGMVIRAMEKHRWIYHSEVCIWKDPVTAMQRTKAIGLLWKQLKKDSSISRQGIADYVVTMRAPGGNEEFISHGAEDFPVSQWQAWASPVWTDINMSDTLQYKSAREHDDERHIAPLQLEVIRRCVVLWSNPGDTVLSPYAGIGSEGYVAIGGATRAGEVVNGKRRFIGFELKRSYFEQMRRNLEIACTAPKQPSLFDDAPTEDDDAPPA